MNEHEKYFKLMQDKLVFKNKLQNNIDIADRVGCFYCKKIFMKDNIEKYTGDDKPLCPFCNVDSIIPLDIEAVNLFVLDILSCASFGVGHNTKGEQLIILEKVWKER
jgi:hypothetical protein